MIDSELVVKIARAAIEGPYRQTKCLDTRKYSRWLSERGIRLDAQTICHLWAAGILCPIAVREDAVNSIPNLAGADRFVDIDPNTPEPYLVDLGVDTDEVRLPLTNSDDFPDSTDEALLWHPFQIVHFLDLADLLKVGLSIQVVVQGGEEAARVAKNATNFMIQSATSTEHHSYQEELRRAIGLLIMADPLVHVDVFHSHTYDSFSGESPSGYLQWIQQQDGTLLLSAAGFNVEEATKWHEKLSFIGQSHDPFGPFDFLVRKSDRGTRKRLRGAGLLSQDIYDIAEILRCYLNRYYSVMLMEEVKVGRIRARHQEAREDVRERVRRMGLDPQERVHWFIEGATEAAYIQRWSELCGIDLREAGIVVHNVQGVGFFRTPQFRDSLKHFASEKIYAYVCTDEDADKSFRSEGKSVPSHIRELTNLDQFSLLPIGFTEWRPNFVSANFSLEELAQIATSFVRDGGSEAVISKDDIVHTMTFHPDGTIRSSPLLVENAIASICKSLGTNLDKGTEWGHLLAEWAVDHLTVQSGRGTPISLEKDDRPITKVLLMLMKAKRPGYSYDLSRQEHLRQQSAK